jgi:pimeloyl-ACP methyl ester carboxylesterase
MRMTAPRETGWIALPDGRRMETAWWGPAPEAAPSLVLLHEGLGCIALWRDLPARLAAATGLGVLAWSRLGYGQSDGIALPRPPDYLHREARCVLPRVLDAAGIRRAVLVGHSDGASIALIHGGLVRDSRIAGIVAMAPHVVVEPVTAAGVAEARRRWETTDLRARLARHHRDPDAAFLGWNEAWLDPGMAARFDLGPEVAAIAVPVLVVQGEADAYGTVEQVRLIQAAARCPVEALVLPGIGHVPQQEAPETVIPAIAGFAARCLGGVRA